MNGKEQLAVFNASLSHCHMYNGAAYRACVNATAQSLILGLTGLILATES